MSIFGFVSTADNRCTFPIPMRNTHHYTALNMHCKYETNSLSAHEWHAIYKGNYRVRRMPCLCHSEEFHVFVNNIEISHGTSTTECSLFRFICNVSVTDTHRSCTQTLSKSLCCARWTSYYSRYISSSSCVVSVTKTHITVHGNGFNAIIIPFDQSTSFCVISDYVLFNMYILYMCVALCMWNKGQKRMYYVLAGDTYGAYCILLPMRACWNQHLIHGVRLMAPLKLIPPGTDNVCMSVFVCSHADHCPCPFARGCRENSGYPLLSKHQWK